VDDVIGKVLKYGYCHHIERLMVLGNFMLLCEIHPDEVYRWFMELFVDAYEWVMVPNIYGMSQFADGGTLSTKPYISGSNYILKMSDYRKGSWCDVWDALYWRFIDKNKDVLRKTFRMGMMVSAYERMDSERKSNMQKIAENFLETL
jgi:deoxyribodipyrimidine photolyase-related protein